MVITLDVFEPAEIRRPGGTRQALAGHARESAGEVGLASGGTFVRENAGVDGLRRPLPIGIHALNPVGNELSFTAHLHPPVHGPAGLDRDGRRESVGHQRVGDAGLDAQVFAERFVVSAYREFRVASLGITSQLRRPSLIVLAGPTTSRSGGPDLEA